MKWRDATFDELVIVNKYLLSEPVLVDSYTIFKRYAKQQGGKDTLYTFERGVTFQLLRVDLYGATVNLTFLQPERELFMKIGDGALTELFGPDFEELLDSVFLDAIRRHNREQEAKENHDDSYGTF